MKKVHYGWIICGLGLLIIFVTIGTVTIGFSVFLPYIMEENGFSNSQISFLTTIRYILSFASMLFIGSYYNRVSLRAGTAIAVTFAGTGYIIYAVSNNYLMYCVGSAITGIGYGLGTMVPITMLMRRWFDERRSFATAVCASGGSISTFVMAPVTTILVESLSLKKAFLIEGIMIFIIAAVVAILMRNDPDEKSLAPYRAQMSSCGKSHREAEEELLSTDEAAIWKEQSGLRQSSYSLSAAGWILLGVSSVSLGAIGNPGFSHISVLLTTEGYDSMMVGAIISAIGLIISVGKLLFGVVADSIGGFKTSIIFMAALLLGHIMCCITWTGNMPVCIAMAALLGIGYPIATLGIPLWSDDMSSRDQYPKVVQKLQTSFTAGALVFSGLPGVMADLLGGYIPVYLLFTGLLAVSLLCVIIAYIGKKAGVTISYLHQ